MPTETAVNVSFLRFITQRTKFAEKAGAMTDKDVHTVLEMQEEVINYVNEVYLSEHKKPKLKCKKKNVAKDAPKMEPVIYTRECPICGGSFKTAQKNAKYCSDTCRKSALAMRNRKQSHVIFDEKYEVSIRLYNILARNDIKTIEELASISERQLWKIRNVGYWTIQEIKALLAKNGLKLAED